MKTDSTHPGHASHCINCGAKVSYHYCAVCGQETKLHVPSATEFMHEFIGHYVALEGRLWKSLYFLLCKPGFLTAEYIAGRRVRYVEPLRIYLTFSILFFAVLKLAGPSLAEFDAQTRAPRPGEAQVQAAPADAAGTRETVTFDKVVIKFSPALEQKVNDFLRMPNTDKTVILTSAFYSYVPYAMFLLMPVFAVYLKLLYLGSGRRYGEHLLFALHSNAFAFLMFATMIAIAPLGFKFLEAVLVLWLIFYLPTAMRRVYGGSRTVTALRWMVLATAHVLSIIGAILAAFALAVFS
ncbi:MAG: DUF3667 domain-containing protein [Pseudomonadota bacterium]